MAYYTASKVKTQGYQLNRGSRSSGVDWVQMHADTMGAAGCAAADLRAFGIFQPHCTSHRRAEIVTREGVCTSMLAASAKTIAPIQYGALGITRSYAAPAQSGPTIVIQLLSAVLTPMSDPCSCGVTQNASAPSASSNRLALAMPSSP